MVARNLKEHVPAYRNPADTITIENAVTHSGVQTFSAANTFSGENTFSAKQTFSVGFDSTPQSVTPAANSGAASTITAGVTSVVVGAVTTDANDWIVLPALADVQNGHEITIVCSAGANFEMRTPATSGEEINSEDCDGTKEYLCTDTQIVKVIKINNTVGWMAHAYTAIGAVAAAVVPD